MNKLALITSVAAGLFCAVSAPAAAQEFAAAVGHTGMGRCHMDTCGFFVIEDAKPVGSTKVGTLYSLAVRSWENEYKARGDSDEHEYDRPPVDVGKPETKVSFVFCSKTKPVEFDFYDGRWRSAALRPGDDAAMFGAAESAYLFYWAACHNFITKDPTSAQMAEKLGYHFRDHPAADDKNDSIQPMDVLR